MSSTSISDNALDALLAESAANVGSPGNSKPRAATSKSLNAFVKFDDLVSAESMPLKSGGVASLNPSVMEPSEGVEQIQLVKGQDILHAPHLVFIGKESTDLCCGSPSSSVGSKWCYDMMPCPTKAHAKTDKIKIEPGLYVKAPGKGKLAFLEPHVPLKLVVGKGYVQELMELNMARSYHEWSMLFQLINLEAGEFDSLSDLDCEILNVKHQANEFKTPRKLQGSTAKVEGLDKSILFSDKESRVKSLGEFEIFKHEMKKELGLDTKSGKGEDFNLTEPLSEDKELLVNAVATLLDKAIDNKSFSEVKKAIAVLERDAQATSAKILDVLADISDLSNKNKSVENLQEELMRLTSESLRFTDRLAKLEAKYQEKWEKLDGECRTNTTKFIELFRSVMNRQNAFDNVITSIKEDIESNQSKNKDKAESDSGQKNSFNDLFNSLPSTNKCGKFNSTMNPSSNPSQDSNGCIHGCSCIDKMEKLEKIVLILQSELEQLKVSKEGEGDGIITIGGLTFSSRDQLHHWSNDHLPAIIPYGCFTDVYSFLNRILDTNSDLKPLNYLVDKHKLNLAGDDAVTLESFQLPLPKLLGASTTVTSLKSAHRSWIGTMPTSSSWENPKNSMGVRNRLTNQIPNVKAQISTNIKLRLGNHSVGYSLAIACLESTISFINSLSSWISDTHFRLTSHGYADELSWQLITQVIYHIFTNDLDQARNFVRDVADTSDPESLHVSVLWGVFSTHVAMEKYMRNGFSAHPTVASQYLDFLVESRGEDSNDQDSKLTKAISKLEIKMEAIEKTAKEARTSASTVANGLNQLKTKVGSMNRNRGGGGGNQ